MGANTTLRFENEGRLEYEDARSGLKITV